MSYLAIPFLKLQLASRWERPSCFPVKHWRQLISYRKTDRMNLFSSFFGIICYLCALVLIQLTLVLWFFYLSDQLRNIELCLVSQNWFMLERNAPWIPEQCVLGCIPRCNRRSLLHGDSCDISGCSGFSFHPVSMLIWALQVDSRKCLVQLYCCVVKDTFSTGFYLDPFICGYYLYTGRQCVWVGKQFSHSVFLLVKNIILAISNLEL